MHSACDLVQFEHLGSCLSHFIFRLAHKRHECLWGGGTGGGEAIIDGGGDLFDGESRGESESRNVFPKLPSAARDLDSISSNSGKPCSRHMRRSFMKTWDRNIPISLNRGSKNLQLFVLVFQPIF
jgi:hypothetical protein